MANILQEALAPLDASCRLSRRRVVPVIRLVGKMAPLRHQEGELLEWPLAVSDGANLIRY